MKTLLKILYFTFPVLITITALEAHVSLDSPTGGATYHPGDIVEIQWTEVVNHGSSVWELYFSPDSGNTWEVIPEIKNMVTFRELNLVEDSAMRMMNTLSRVQLPTHVFSIVSTPVAVTRDQPGGR